MIKKINYLIVPIIVTILALSRGVQWSLIQWMTALSLAVIIRVPWVNLKLSFGMKYPLFHVYTFIIAFMFSHGFIWALGWYLSLIASSILVNITPESHKKGISILITILAIAINVFIIKPPMVLEWVIPLLFVNNIIVKKTSMNMKPIEA